MTRGDSPNAKMLRVRYWHHRDVSALVAKFRSARSS
jgi:hypothetical protein